MEKCKTVHFFQPCKEAVIDYTLFDNSLVSVNEEKDLGVLFDNQLNFQEHIASCVAKARSKFGWMKRVLVSRDEEVILQIFKHLIRPHLEYCTQVWAPAAEHGNWKNIMNIESIQREVTKIIVGSENLSYKDRLDK